jgi:hypothetical protein
MDSILDIIKSQTTPRRMLVPYLILRSAAERHSILAGSVISALLSFVLFRRNEALQQFQRHVGITCQ